MPVVNISASFQLSGRGDGFTRSFEIVMIVPLKSETITLAANKLQTQMQVEGEETTDHHLEWR